MENKERRNEIIATIALLVYFAIVVGLGVFLVL